MNDRLKRFMDAENISQAQLADNMGVARASISHILAGRNKPSYDFLLNLAQHYPTLNLEWLLTAKGKMYNSIVANTLFEQSEDYIDASRTAIPDAKTPPQPTLKQIYTNNTQETSRSESNIPEHSTITSPLFDSRLNTIAKKRITKLLVFYDDNSYEEIS